MAEEKKKPAPKRKAGSSKPRPGLAGAREETLQRTGEVIARARKEIGMTQKKLGDALNFTSAQIARIEQGAARLPFDRIGKAINTLRISAREAALLNATRDKARTLSAVFSGQARAAWNRLSESEARKLTRDMLELGGYLPGTGDAPSVEERVLFAVRAAGDNERRFRTLLDAFGVELGAASKVITKALEKELPARKKPARRGKAPAKKGS